jgi:hypothetical protein
MELYCRLNTDTNMCPIPHVAAIWFDASVPPFEISRCGFLVTDNLAAAYTLSYILELLAIRYHAWLNRLRRLYAIARTRGGCWIGPPITPTQTLPSAYMLVQSSLTVGFHLTNYASVILWQLITWLQDTPLAIQWTLLHLVTIPGWEGWGVWTPFPGLVLLGLGAVVVVVPPITPRRTLTSATCLSNRPWSWGSISRNQRA